MAKQGFSERLYLKYLRTKFKTLGILSPSTAGKKAFELFCTPFPKYKKTKAPAIFNQASRISLTLPNQTQIQGYKWEASKPNGKTILICHGYASYFYKFEQYIAPLLKAGFSIIGFDAPAHGQSQGKLINAVIYKEAVESIIQAFGPIDHFMGHSLGGLTISLVAEQLKDQENHKIVLIAPATKTTTTFESFFNLMHFSPEVKQGFLAELEQQTHFPISYFEADRAVQDYKGPLLWVHDTQDRICPYKDLENFTKSAPSNINFLITNNLGHNKIYKTQSVIDEIVQFLAG